MKYALRVAKISGINIEVHWTFLILIVWVIFSDLRSNVASDQIFWSILLVLTVFVCVILHELGHALTAKKFNIRTTRITLLPIGGLAQMEQIPEKPREELIVAFAGPAVNLVIAAALYPFADMTSAGFQNADAHINADNFLLILMTLNLWLALFNLIPAFPMDGGRVLRAMLSFKLGHVKATRIAASIGQMLGIGFVFFGLFYNPFLVLIGIFIYLGAGSESAYAQTKSMLAGYSVKDVIMHDIPFLDKDAPLNEAVHQLLNSQNKNFVVTDHGKPVGTLSRGEIIKALHEHDSEVLVDQVKNDALVYLNPEMPLENVWREMQKQQRKIVLVGSNEKLEGIVDDENLAEFILIHSAADGASTKYL